MNDQDDGRLDSWKEIAAYLGCDVRTCMRWEKERGLPIHRPGGETGPRVRVTAWKNDLDIWLAGTSHREPPAMPDRDLAKGEAGKADKSLKLIWIPAVLIILGVAAFFAIRTLTMDREPADFHIDGTRLLILNKAKKVLWPFETRFADLWPEDYYREKFQIRTTDKYGNRYSPSLVIEDIDKDGHNEVLFVPHHLSPNNSRKLYCLDYKGHTRWDFDGGRELVFGTQTYSWDYFSYVETHDIDGDGRKEIFVVSENLQEFPTQLSILTCDRRVLGEYWHRGRITDFNLSDIDGDGRPELIMGGVDEETTKAFAAILDPWKLSGGSPYVNADYKCPALSAGSERAYVLVPLMEFEPGKDRHMFAAAIMVLDNGRIRVETSQYHNQFDIDPKTLACVGITFSNDYQVKHREAVETGQTHSVLDDAYRENLKKGFLYWTGQAYASTPTWVLKGPAKPESEPLLEVKITRTWAFAANYAENMGLELTCTNGFQKPIRSFSGIFMIKSPVGTGGQEVPFKLEKEISPGQTIVDKSLSMEFEHNPVGDRDYDAIVKGFEIACEVREIVLADGTTIRR